MTIRKPYPLLRKPIESDDLRRRRDSYGLTVYSVAEMAGVGEYTVKVAEGCKPRAGSTISTGSLFSVDAALRGFEQQVLARERTPLPPIRSESDLYRAIDQAASEAMLVESIHVPTRQREYTIARAIAFRIASGFLSRRKAAEALLTDRASTKYWQSVLEACSPWIKDRAAIAESRVRAAILQACVDNPDNAVYLEGRTIRIRK